MEHLTGMVVGVTFWVFLGAIIVGPMYLKSKERERMHETLRIAYEKGQPVPPEMIAALQSNQTLRVESTPERDLRRAIVLIAVGLGLCVLGYGMWYGLSSVSDIAAYVTGGSIAGAGAIPGLIGVAYLILYVTRRGATKA
ncbi:MAG TPA: DUF6249 domain-containing protein [Caulobacteraceae bacterium]|nr:DUF6249 domain-containing protein [Caulobacteraceae bacterium]